MKLKFWHFPLAATVLWTGSKLLGAAQVAKHIIIEPVINIHSIGIDALTLAVDAVIRNPSNGRVKISFPFVQILMDGMFLASTEQFELEVPINPNSTISLDQVLRREKGKRLLLRIPFRNLIWQASPLISLISGAIPFIELSIQTSLKAFIPGLPVGGIAITDTQTIQLSKPSRA